MRDLEKVFERSVINYNRLLEYGFNNLDGKYIYETRILNDSFKMNVVISDKEKYSKLVDLESDTEYALVDVEDAVGEFVGKVRYEYEKILDEIFEKCTTKEVFKSSQAKEVIEYIRKKYSDELEFLWEKFDDNAIWRNKQNSKWYGALLIVSKKVFNENSDEKVEIIDLRYQKDKIESVIDGKLIFPGYHMNKQSWITIKLDYSINNEELFKLIDNSYQLSVGNKCGLAGNGLAQKVFEYLTTIPKGKVVTYKQVAEHLGNKGLARVVGNILHKNPDGDKYPCYKVLNSKGELAEAFVFGGKNVQKERLEKQSILEGLQKGETQAEIAEKIGRSQSYVSKIKAELVKNELISDDRIKAAKQNAQEKKKLIIQIKHAKKMGILKN